MFLIESDVVAPLQPLFNKIYFDNNYLKKDCDDELVITIRSDLATKVSLKRYYLTLRSSLKWFAEKRGLLNITERYG